MDLTAVLEWRAMLGGKEECKHYIQNLLDKVDRRMFSHCEKRPNEAFTPTALAIWFFFVGGPS